MTRTQYPRLEPDGKLILYHCKIENCAPLLLYIYIFIGKYFTFVPGTLSRKIWQNIDYRPKHKQVIYQYHILKKKMQVLSKRIFSVSSWTMSWTLIIFDNVFIISVTGVTKNSYTLSKLKLDKIRRSTDKLNFNTQSHTGAARQKWAFAPRELL